MEHSRDSLSDGLSGGGHMTSFLNNQKCECCGAALWLPEYKKDSYLPCLQWPSYTSAVNAYITTRIEGILTSFSIDPHKLLEGMETCVLANVDSFAPNDLDIYVPEAHAETLAKRILSRFKSVGGHSPIYDLNPAITHVEWYTSNFHPLIHVNIIATKSTSPLEALFHSGASITMNAITGRGIFTAYADLTARKISLLPFSLSLPTAKLFRAVRNRSSLPQDEAHTILAHFGISVPVTALPWELMELLVKKYKSRVGVTFIRDLAAIKDHTSFLLFEILVKNA
ncbi:uncharacterized protein LACBIDRAFT_335816 [Laccaria bicolor S238N-H82]|uniref:Predicted protein n=1 Tax=Laccaria bicolor (strain S238N-H82 / ATCC MYA-4686) TaxID=486041 RepID=B0E3I1_LACBS|nr:uncharacterized protein LACBIDRAFT_335816 [Laccaria bicolor S238N-H82]EDQ98600.1 predicted protein [Laccaria bicolor S238N-H82]|eukprot:XP_001890747.1 predicted protein [Laccaria bicolor S238N-H82]